MRGKDKAHPGRAFQVRDLLPGIRDVVDIRDAGQEATAVFDRIRVVEAGRVHARNQIAQPAVQFGHGLGGGFGLGRECSGDGIEIKAKERGAAEQVVALPAGAPYVDAV